MVFIGVAILFFCLIVGMPVFFAFLASAMWFIFIGDVSPTFMIPYGLNKISGTVLFAIPLFVIAGGLMAKGNIADKMIDLVEDFVGRVRGGLGVVATISCAIFGSVTGSACATLTCIGSIMFPRFIRANYPMGHCAALLASTAVLGMLIPPSAIMILYSWAGGQSVLASFLSTVIPGIMLTALISFLNCYMLRNNKEILVTSSDAAPTSSDFEKTLQMMEKKQQEKFSLFRSKKFKAIPALLMPIIVLGGIYSGIMTPTEAAAVSVIYALPVGMFIYKGITLNGLRETLIDGVMSTGAIMIMLFSCSVISRIYIMNDLPQEILKVLYSISTNKYVILFMLNIFMIILGMLMDDCSACVLATPILLPIVLEIGVSPVHFAAILGVNLGLGNITPPCAPLLYLSSSISKTSINDMLRPTCTFILFGWLPILALTTYVPALSMWLPRLILGIK
ncbi:MAG: TRAP transporter large permease subunit [Synergistaceae bacterium]|nr:TRAP transporter large permease subunit [Synergistaceae bacterium]NLW61751.1 TRAP transporter large permease subunit [Synergistaceae bacterium]